MKNIVYPLLLIAASMGVAHSNPLKENDPEHAQLIAMGYDIEESDSGSIASRGNTTIFLMKTDKVVFLARYFILDPKKVAREEYKALQLINKQNLIQAFSLTINEEKDQLICAHYYYGAYERKRFATIVSEIEACNIIFDKEPWLMELGPK